MEDLGFAYDEGQRLSAHEYVSLARAYQIRCKSVFVPPYIPTVFGVVEGKASGEVIAYLWFNPARSEWVLFSEASATDEVVELFS